MKHEQFLPLSSPGGDGRNDIALLYIRTKEGRGIQFDKFVGPACLPPSGTQIKRFGFKSFMDFFFILYFIERQHLMTQA